MRSEHRSRRLQNPEPLPLPRPVARGREEEEEEDDDNSRDLDPPTPNPSSPCHSNETTRKRRCCRAASTPSHHISGTDGIMLIRHLLKTEITRSSPSYPLTETSLIHMTRAYWKKLSQHDKEIIQRKAERNFYSLPSSMLRSNDPSTHSAQPFATAASSDKDPLSQLPITPHILPTDESHLRSWQTAVSNSTEEESPTSSARQISKDIPVLYSNKLDKDRHHLMNRIVAAQLSKQFTPIPVDDPHIALHHPAEVIEQINEKYLQQSQLLRDFSEFQNENEIQQALRYYRDTLPWRGRKVGTGNEESKEKGEEEAKRKKDEERKERKRRRRTEMRRGDIQTLDVEDDDDH